MGDLKIIDFDIENEVLILKNVSAGDIDLSGCYLAQLEGEQRSAAFEDASIESGGLIRVWTCPGKYDQDDYEENESNLYWRNYTDGEPRAAKLLRDRRVSGVALKARSGETLVDVVVRDETQESNDDHNISQPQPTLSRTPSSPNNPDYANMKSLLVSLNPNTNPLAKELSHGSIWDKGNGKYWPQPSPVQRKIQVEAKKYQTTDALDTFNLYQDTHDKDGETSKGVRLNPLTEESSADPGMITIDIDSLEASTDPNHRPQSIVIADQPTQDVGGVIEETDVDRPTLFPAAPKTVPVEFDPVAKPYSQLDSKALCSSKGLCFLSKCQGSFLARVAPAGWVPCLRAMHGHDAEWNLARIGRLQLFNLTLDALKTLSGLSGEQIALSVVDRDAFKIVAHCYTPLEWVDKLEITFHETIFHKPGYTSITGTKAILHAKRGGLPKLVPVILLC